MRCIRVTTPAVANEKDEQKTAHRALEEDSSSFFCCFVSNIDIRSRVQVIVVERVAKRQIYGGEKMVR